MLAKRFLSLLTPLILLSLFAACKPQAPPEEPQPPAPTPRTTTPEPAPAEPEDVEEWKEPAEPEVAKLSAGQLAQQAAEFNRQGVLTAVFFETNKSDLTDDARRALAANAAWLRGHPEFGVLIAGHCDERNTEEYNLALGERRADAARAYLASLGVVDARLETISYGEERPVNRGHDERAWSQNRRAEFEVQVP